MASSELKMTVLGMMIRSEVCDADDDAHSSNTRSSILWSVPSSPGRSFFPQYNPMHYIMVFLPKVGRLVESIPAILPSAHFPSLQASTSSLPSPSMLVRVITSCTPYISSPQFIMVLNWNEFEPQPLSMFAKLATSRIATLSRIVLLVSVIQFSVLISQSVSWKGLLLTDIRTHTLLDHRYTWVR